MDIFSELREQIESLDHLLDDGPDELIDAMRCLPNEHLVRVIEAAARAARCLGRVEAVRAGVLAERSTREAGQSELAQVR